MPQERVKALAINRGIPSNCPCFLVGMRGYYLNSMGAPNRNDRGIYDDAIFLVSHNAFASFNANVDPSTTRKGIATLGTGIWRYRIGVHGLHKAPEKRYKALVQAAPVRVLRDGQVDETGYFGINIHRGSRTSTSSLGCQTIYPTQWDAFIALVESEMKRAGLREILYLLTEHQG